MPNLALVHVPGLGAQPSASEYRISPRLVLPWLADGWVGACMTEGIPQRCAQMLQRDKALPPVSAAFVVHPHLRPAALARAGREMALVDWAQRLAQQYTGPSDRLLPLEYSRALVERMVGKCGSVEEAKRVARACLLRLHPDRVGLPDNLQAREGQLSLFRGYCAVLELLEDPVVGPHTVGPVVRTGRQAAQVLFSVACQRVGCPAALVGLSVGTVGLVGGVAWTLTALGAWHHLASAVIGLLLGLAVTMARRRRDGT